MKIRDASTEDFASIVALNHRFVSWTSPMDGNRLAHLNGLSCYHRVLVNEHEKVMAFLIAMPGSVDYDSENYRWFNSRYSQFLYIDRIVVKEEAQGIGAGRLLYEDLFAFAGREGFDLVTCEFNVRPANPGSAKFHDRLGFREVGTQELDNGRKIVSLQVKTLAG